MSKGTGVSNPFRGELVLCIATLLLALIATIQSLKSNVNVFPFLPLDILFVLTVTRTYQLVLAFEKKETGEKMRPLRDLPLHERLVIAVHVIGLFILIGLGMYLLHWMVV